MKNRKEDMKEKSSLKFIDVIHTMEVIKWLYEKGQELAPVVIEYLRGFF